MINIFRYEWKFFLRNRVMIFSWLLMLVVGIYSLHYGHVFNNTQVQTLHSIDTAYQHRVQKQLQNFSADTSTKEGKTAYRNAHDAFLNEWSTRPMAWKQPTGLQAMSLGQSDNQPFYYNLWVYNNVYNTKQVELRNPDKLLAGNFDLSFVIIYLLPLLIIAFCYSITSHDDESGITSLLVTQGCSQQRITIYRLLFRGLIVLVLALLLSVAGFILNTVSIADSFAWIGVSLVYITFWLSLAYLFISRRRSGSLTALQLVSSWIILLLLVPSLINSTQEVNRQAPVKMADAGRDYAGHIWSLDKRKLADTLFQLKPAWKEWFGESKDSNELRSTAYGYFMAQKLNGVGQQVDSGNLQVQLKLEKLNLINPVFSAQLLYNKLAATELNNYVQLRKAVASYQQERYELITQKRLPKILLTRADYEAYPVFRQPVAKLSITEWITGLGPLLFFILLFTMTGNLTWKNKHLKK